MAIVGIIERLNKVKERNQSRVFGIEDKEVCGRESENGG
jgi:hypothetical protein